MSQLLSDAELKDQWKAEHPGEEHPWDMLQRLGDDAMEWAKEFSKTAVKLGYSEMPVDWLVVWFASAICHSEDVRRWRAEKAAS